jgi:hypothetical protein
MDGEKAKAAMTPNATATATSINNLAMGPSPFAKQEPPRRPDRRKPPCHSLLISAIKKGVFTPVRRFDIRCIFHKVSGNLALPKLFTF